MKMMETTPAKLTPFDFVIEGPAVSHQPGDKKRLDRWKEQVKEAASEGWNADPLPTSRPVAVTITYFTKREPGEARDVDNLAKPILDAMKGVVYCDDEQVSDLLCRIRGLETKPRIVNLPADLTEYLKESRPVVHVRVDPSPDPTVKF